MRSHSSLLALGLICCVHAVDYQGHSLDFNPGLSLADVYGNVTRNTRWRASNHIQHIKEYVRAGISDSLERHNFLSHRSQRSCDFAIDLLIVQDATGSFERNFQVTANRTLPAMAREIPAEHPGSTFSMITFRDKPVPSLGELDDDCVTVQKVGATDPMELAEFYRTEEPGNGWDTPENQYGALMVALNSPKTIPWHTNPLATPIIVLITDSRPHFHGDTQHKAFSELKDWPEDGFDEDAVDDMCSQHYYPSPETLRNALWDAKAYMSTIIVRPAGFAGDAVASWQWFNSYAGYPDSFVQLCEDDDEGWEIELQHIIDAVEAMECDISTTETPTNAPAGGTEEGVTRPGEDDVTTTTQRSGTAAASDVASGECPCHGEDNCPCWQQPDLFVALYKRAKELDIHMRKDASI